MLFTSALESFRILDILMIPAICNLGSSCKDVFGLVNPAAGRCPGFGFLVCVVCCWMCETSNPDINEVSELMYLLHILDSNLLTYLGPI